MNANAPGQAEKTVAQITLRRGSIYLTADIYRRYFDGLEAVILMRRSDDLLILPVNHAAAGGYLLKLRNAAGDRVINAMDFLYSNGIDDATEMQVSVCWSQEMIGLIAADVFGAAN